MPGFRDGSFIKERYQILSYVGGGLFTEVYKVKDLISDKVLGLKILKPDYKNNQLIASRLAQEFFLLSHLAHPNIITVLDFNHTPIKQPEEALPFFTMEFFDGLAINKFFANGYNDELLAVVIEILKTLDFIHSLSFVHADLKPEHILISQKINNYGEKTFSLKLLDFGFCEKIIPISDEVRGTIGYVAPELLKGTYFDQRADFYSLGIILYEIITQEGPKKYQDNILRFLRLQYEEKIPFCEEIAKKNNLPLPPKKFSLLVHSLIGNINKRPCFAYEIFEIISPLLKKEEKLKAQTYKKPIAPALFIGRKEIFEKLKNLFKEVKENNASIFVLIFGERGIGKSRLSQEFKYYLNLEQAQTFNFISGLAGRPLSLLEQLLKTFSLYNKDLLNFKIKLNELDTEIAQKELLTLYERIFQTIIALKKMENRPLVLFFDDLELLDDLSLNLFRYITYGLQKEGILILATSLKEENIENISEMFKNRENFVCFELPPLKEEETLLLIKDMLSLRESVSLGMSEASEVSVEEFSSTLYALSGGNPLFIVEIMNSLLESDILSFLDGKFVYNKEKFDKSLKERTLNLTNISTILKERLKKLSKEELEILQVATLLGKPFSLKLINKILNYQDSFLYKKILSLVNNNLLKLVISASPKYYLTSKILEAVVQEGIFYEEKKYYHQKIAAALRSLYPTDEILFELAFHYAQADAQTEALYYSNLAAEKAKSLSLFKESLFFYEIKLRFLPKETKPIERSATMEEIGRLRELLGFYEEAIDIYKQAISVCIAAKEEKSIISKFLRNCGLVSLFLGKYEEAINYFDEALNFTKELKTETAIKLLADKGFALIKTNKLEAEKLLEKALSLSADLKIEKKLISTIYYYLSVLYYEKGEVEEAIRIMSKVLEMGKEIEPVIFNRFQQFYASLLFIKRDLDGAEKIYKKSYEESKERKETANLIISEIGLASIYGEKRDFEKARSYLEEALSKAKRAQMKEQERDILINLASLNYFYDFKKAEEGYKELLKIYEKEGKDHYYYIQALLNYAELLIKMGRVNEAKAFIEELEKKKDDEIVFQLKKLKPLYYLAEGDLENLSSSLEEVSLFGKNLKKEDDIDFLLFLGEFYLLFGEIYKAKGCVEKILSKIDKEASFFFYLNSERLLGVCEMLLGKLEEGKERLFSLIAQYKKLNMKYEVAKTFIYLILGYKKLSAYPTFIFSDILEFKILDNKELLSLKSYLEEAKFLFEDFDAKMDLELIALLEKQLEKIEKSDRLRISERTQYLKIFYQISEIINLGIEKEDFFEKIIDLAIDASGAERGILFLFFKDKLTPVAGRAIDHSTLEDATEISMSAIKRIKYVPEPILVSDALNDPRFKNAPSVILNKIRSLLCVPLKTDEKIIGAIYLDSRITSHIFLDEDRSLLISIANLLAATIDKSNIFSRIQKDALFREERLVIDEKTGFILGKSKQMRQIYELVEKVAPAECTVLLTGETGTGKNVLAEYIHLKSKRRDKKFYTINCGGLTETLFESELFGHVRGAFTGAIKDKEGLLEITDGGTIFLDEISNIPLNTQPKILEFLETKIIRRVGSTEIKRVDVRLICASNKNLEEEVKKGRLKEDLYFRINAVTIHLPPLRERIGDIPYFANHFLKRFSQMYNKQITGLDDKAISCLIEYPWPGNIRELQNLIHYAVVATIKKRVSLDELITIKPQLSEYAQKITEKINRKTLSKEEIIEALKNTKGNVSHAAQNLGIHRRQLQRLIKRYDINRAQFKEQP